MLGLFCFSEEVFANSCVTPWLCCIAVEGLQGPTGPEPHPAQRAAGHPTDSIVSPRRVQGITHTRLLLGEDAFKLSLAGDPVTNPRLDAQKVRQRVP